MTSKSLASLRLAQLKHAAFLSGLPSTGTKADLVTVLQGQPASTTSTSGGGRVLSVDMGIRNMAYCVVDVPGIDKSRKSHGLARDLKVPEWTKLDLLPVVTSVDKRQNSDDASERTSSPARQRRKQPTVTVPAWLFTPSQLSKTAYSVTKELLSHKPDTILIERQRFRSGGAAAIQEWTVRVNMLESMLWACLQTLRETRDATAGRFPTVHEVNPARVASFWTFGPATSLQLTADTFAVDPVASVSVDRSDVGRKRVQKKDKIALVRAWLKNAPGAAFAFEGDAAKVAKAFTAPGGRSARRANIDVEDNSGKLDDLADCLLQAAAWIKWEENRAALKGVLTTSATH